MSLFATRSAWQSQERLGPEARRAIRRSERLSAERGWHRAPPDSLLIALLDEPGGVASSALAALAISAAEVTAAAEAAVVDRGTPLPGRSPLDTASREAVVLGVNEARRSGLPHAGGGHLLVGILEAGSGAGARLLTRHRVAVNSLRSVVEELEHATSTEDGRPAKFAAMMEELAGAMPCKHCGATVHVSFRYCYNCGALL